MTKSTARKSLLLFSGIVILTALLVMVLWITAPRWSAWALQRYLPEDWTVQSFVMERPNLGRLTITQLHLTGPVAGQRLQIRAQDLHLRYNLLARKIESVVAQRIIAQLDTDQASIQIPEERSFALDDLTLPPLVITQTTPELMVRNLEVLINTNAGEHRLHLNQLHHDPVSGHWQVSANFSAIPWLRGKGEFEMTLREGAAHLALNIDDSKRGMKGRMQITQEYRAPETDASATSTARVDVDLPLQLIRLEEIEQPGWLPGGAPIHAMTGKLQARLDFSGQEQLALHSAEFTLHSGLIEAEQFTVQVSGKGHAERQGSTLHWTQNTLEVVADGGLAPWIVPLRELLAEAGLHDSPLKQVSSLSLALPGAMSIRIPFQAPLPVDGIGALSVHMEMPDESGLSVTVNDWRWSVLNDSGEWRFSSDGALEGQMRLASAIQWSSDEDQLWASGVHGSFTGTHSLSNNQLQNLNLSLQNLDFAEPNLSNNTVHLAGDAISINGKLEMASEGVKYSGPVQGENLEIFLSEDPSGIPMLVAGGLTAQLSVLQGASTRMEGTTTLWDVKFPGQGVTLDALESQFVNLLLPDQTGEVHWLTSGLSLRLDDDLHEGFELDVQSTLLPGNVWEAQGELLLGYSSALPLKLRATLEPLTLLVQLEQAMIPASGLHDAARAMALPLPPDVQFQSGVVTIDGEVTLEDRAGVIQPGGTLNIKAAELDAQWGESRAQGLSFLTDMTLSEPIMGVGEIAFEHASLAAGVEILRLHTDLNMPGQESLALTHLRAELFDGLLQSSAIEVVDGALQDIKVTLSEFDLAQLLKVLDVNGLVGEGRMNTQLPLVMTQEGLAIEEGTFAATGPGLLRYRSGVPASNIGLQALENFHYETLEGTINYQADGGYRILLNLLGRNPDLYGGHPIRFKLNLDGELPSLFRSLFVTGDFNQAIIEHLRSSQEENPLEFIQDQ